MLEIKTSKKIIFTIFLIIFLIFFYLILNKETTKSIYVNYDLIQYKLPLYQRIYGFLNRHFNYNYLVEKINNDQSNKKDIVLNTSKWVFERVKRIPEGVDIIDSDPLSIIESRLGDQYQFNDILSVLLVYQNVDSIFYNDNIHTLTLFKINNYWSVLDPYFGVYFINENKKFASIDDLNTTKWDIVNLDSTKIDSLKLLYSYDGKYANYNELKNHYKKIFINIGTSSSIDQISLFEQSGRSYIQKPFNRIKYEFQKFLNKFN